MQKSFTHEEMQVLKGCYTREKLAACSFMARETVTVESILDSEISLRDKLWFVYASCGLELDQKYAFR